MARKIKTRRQVKFLTGRRSPLTRAQKKKLRGELKSGVVRVRRKRKRGR